MAKHQDDLALPAQDREKKKQIDKEPVQKLLWMASMASVWIIISWSWTFQFPIQKEFKSSEPVVTQQLVNATSSYIQNY